MEIYIFLVMVAIALFFVVRYDQKIRREREQRERQEEAEAFRQAMADAIEKDERGERLFQALIRVAFDHPLIGVGRIKDNAGAYSIIVQRRDEDGTKVGSGYQFNVYSDRLTSFCGFGPQNQRKVDPSQFDAFLTFAEEQVKLYCNPA